MTYQLTPAQRLLLADCLRDGILGWLLTCPAASQRCREFHARATSPRGGFSFSRFATLVISHFGPDFRPYCPGSTATFPVSIEEAVVIANDLELDSVTDDEVYAAALVAARCPCAQPQIKSRRWRLYLATMAAVGLDALEGTPHWRGVVIDRLGELRQHLRQLRHPIAAAVPHAAE